MVLARIKDKLSRVLISLMLITIAGLRQSDCQVLKDSSTMNLISKGVDCIYSMNFNEARQISGEVKSRYPGHPVILLLNAMITYWENYPLLPDSPMREIYERDLRNCISASEDEHGVTYDNAEFHLANLSARGLLLLFYSDNDISKNVIPLAASTYKPLRKAFDYTAESTDLLYFTGLYNYYRDAYPRIYPIYKTVAFLFPPGDSMAGLTQMKISSERAFVLNAESSFMLFWIYLHYEQDYNKSYEFISGLCERYPDNPLHRLMLVKNLILLRRYDAAEEAINEGASSENGFYMAAVKVYKGLLAEKKYGAIGNAVEYWHEAIDDLETFRPYSNDHLAIAYYGLSRSSKAEGKRDEMRTYHRQAASLADFKKINFDD